MREHADELFERDEAFARLARQFDEALDLRRQADQRIHEFIVAVLHQFERDGEAEIGDEGKGMRRIDGQRRQNRKHMQQEILFEPGEFRLGQILRIDENDAGRLEFAAQFAPAALLFGGEQARALADLDQLLGGRQPVFRARIDAGAHLAAQTRDADHEEFVEIIGRDREKPQLLEQRVIAVRRFLQHAAIEFEPGQFAVDEALRRAREFFRMFGDLADLIHDRNGGGRRSGAGRSRVRRHRLGGRLDSLCILCIRLHRLLLRHLPAKVPLYFDGSMIPVHAVRLRLAQLAARLGRLAFFCDGFQWPSPIARHIASLIASLREQRIIFEAPLFPRGECRRRRGIDHFTQSKP